MLARASARLTPAHALPPFCRLKEGLASERARTRDLTIALRAAPRPAADGARSFVAGADAPAARPAVWAAASGGLVAGRPASAGAAGRK